MRPCVLVVARPVPRRHLMMRHQHREEGEGAVLTTPLVWIPSEIKGPKWLEGGE